MDSNGFWGVLLHRCVSKIKILGGGGGGGGILSEGGVSPLSPPLFKTRGVKIFFPGLKGGLLWFFF